MSDKPTREFIRYSLETLRSMASRRPPGHLEDVVSRAAWTSADGLFVFIPRDAAAELREKYRTFWEPEMEKMNQKSEMPGWWQNYLGARGIGELQDEVANIFDFRVPPKDERIAALRSEADKFLQDNPNCSTCAMNGLTSKLIFKYISQLNEHERPK